jgi:hypothetical protein
MLFLSAAASHEIFTGDEEIRSCFLQEKASWPPDLLFTSRPRHSGFTRDQEIRSWMFFKKNIS